MKYQFAAVALAAVAHGQNLSAVSGAYLIVFSHSHNMLMHHRVLLPIREQ